MFPAERKGRCDPRDGGSAHSTTEAKRDQRMKKSSAKTRTATPNRFEVKGKERGNQKKRIKDVLSTCRRSRNSKKSGPEGVRTGGNRGRGIPTIGKQKNRRKGGGSEASRAGTTLVPGKTEVSAKDGKRSWEKGIHRRSQRLYMLPTNPQRHREIESSIDRRKFNGAILGKKVERSKKGPTKSILVSRKVGVKKGETKYRQEAIFGDQTRS